MQMRKLITVGANRIEFRMTSKAKSFYLSFFIIGGLVFLFPILVQRPLSVSSFIFLILVYAALCVTGGLMIFSSAKPIIFDKIRGFYWKGRKKPDEVCARQNPGSCARIEDIHALQLLSKMTTGGSNESIYELNLILNNSRRIHLTDQRNLDAARNHASILSRFLEKPIWDATQ
jgi:hypothetical protein